jgi:hypothetical protein
MRRLRFALILVAVLVIPQWAFSACTTGQTTCNTDTTQDAQIVSAIINPQVQERVSQCLDGWRATKT